MRMHAAVDESLTARPSRLLCPFLSDAAGLLSRFRVISIARASRPAYFALVITSTRTCVCARMYYGTLRICCRRAIDCAVGPLGPSSVSLRESRLWNGLYCGVVMGDARRQLDLLFGRLMVRDVFFEELWWGTLMFWWGIGGDCVQLDERISVCRIMFAIICIVLLSFFGRRETDAVCLFCRHGVSKLNYIGLLRNWC